MEIKRVSTGCESLDELLGGGIEHGIITNFYGESGSGKTNVCMQIAAQVAKEGKKIAYIDTEGGFSPERFIQMAGENALENVLLKDVTQFHQQDETIKSLEELNQEEDLDMVVVDSMVSLYRLKVDSENANQINNKLSNQLSLLSKLAREQEIPVLVTNQVYTSFDDEKLELVGRDVPKYWSKCLIKLSRKDKNLREAEISKHRSRPEGRTVRFKITMEGIESSNEGIL